MTLNTIPNIFYPTKCNARMRELYEDKLSIHIAMKVLLFIIQQHYKWTTKFAF